MICDFVTNFLNFLIFLMENLIFLAIFLQNPQKFLHFSSKIFNNFAKFSKKNFPFHSQSLRSSIPQNNEIDYPYPHIQHKSSSSISNKKFFFCLSSASRIHWLVWLCLLNNSRISKWAPTQPFTSFPCVCDFISRMCCERRKKKLLFCCYLKREYFLNTVFFFVCACLLSGAVFFFFDVDVVRVWRNYVRECKQ